MMLIDSSTEPKCRAVWAEISSRWSELRFSIWWVQLFDHYINMYTYNCDNTPTRVHTYNYVYTTTITCTTRSSVARALHPHLRWNHHYISLRIRGYRRVKEPTHRRRSHVAAGDIQRATHESTRLYPHRYRRVPGIGSATPRSPTARESI